MQCTCRGLNSFVFTPEWIKPLGIKPGLIKQQIRLYAPAGGKQKPTIPVRCIVASRNIARGERICVTPPESVLTGHKADNLIREICTRAQHASLALPTYTDLISSIHNMDRSAPELLLTRDGVLLTLLLYLLRSTRYASVIPNDHPLCAWAHSLPPHAPPLALLLREHYEEDRKFTPLGRRSVMNKNFATGFLPTADVKDESEKLLGAALEPGHLEALPTSHSEVAITEEILSDFYRGKPSALTERQHDMGMTRIVRYANHCSLRHLMDLEHQLSGNLIMPLLKLLYTPCPSKVDDALSSEEVRYLNWAHFMLRSRVVNVSSRSRPPLMALVPFVDCLNHSQGGANITYFRDPLEEAVVVTASKPIAAGEELVLQYNNYTQRGCLFGDPPPRLNRVMKDLGPENYMNASPRKKAVIEEVHQIESWQRREIQADEDMNTSQDGDSTFAPLSHECDINDEMSEARLAQREAVVEAIWLWRYGFLRSDSEKLYEASKRWSNGLRNRIANLTDVRRKGRPGEFVIGVPEGLEHLRAQRERLEREWYQNTRIFPPQSA